MFSRAKSIEIFVMSHLSLIINCNVSNLVEENPIDCLATNESLDNLFCIYSNLSESDIASLQVILSNEQEGLILEDALNELSTEIDTICN